MAALAYVLLPFSGLVAFVTGGRERVRFHGAQSMVFSTLWAAALFGASALSSVLTLIVAIGGAVAWMTLLIATASGRDPALPGLKTLLWKAAGAGADPLLKDEP